MHFGATHPVRVQSNLFCLLGCLPAQADLNVGCSALALDFLHTNHLFQSISWNIWGFKFHIENHWKSASFSRLKTRLACLFEGVKNVLLEMNEKREINVLVDLHFVFVSLFVCSVNLDLTPKRFYIVFLAAIGLFFSFSIISFDYLLCLFISQKEIGRNLVCLLFWSRKFSILHYSMYFKCQIIWSHMLKYFLFTMLLKKVLKIVSFESIENRWY